MTGFKATVCASTGDNWHNCAPTRWWFKAGDDCKTTDYMLIDLIIITDYICNYWSMFTIATKFYNDSIVEIVIGSAATR